MRSESPYFRKDIDLLEKVQRRTTKLVQSIASRDYATRLNILGLYTLEQRRVRGDLIETYKILTGKDNIKEHQFFTRATGTTRPRGNPLKLFKGRARETELFQPESCEHLEQPASISC
jgi:ribonuclease P/MRP protein subunit RPP40